MLLVLYINIINITNILNILNLCKHASKKKIENEFIFFKKRTLEEKKKVAPKKKRYFLGQLRSTIPLGQQLQSQGYEASIFRTVTVL